MKVLVSYFGGLRARLGLDSQAFDLAEGSRAADLAALACGHLGVEWGACLAFAVNDDLVAADTPLKDGDQVALLPPVCGGSGEGGACFLTREPLDLGPLLAGLDDPACGAVAVFVGRVREEQSGRAVLRLDYEAYEVLALKQMEAVLDEARARWSLGPLILAHRVGRLEIGETAVVAAATSGHRSAAFEACAFIIAETKAKVPIWKHEHYADLGQAWVGAPESSGENP